MKNIICWNGIYNLNKKTKLSINKSYISNNLHKKIK